MFKVFTLICFVFTCIFMKAQQRFVAIDMETKVPLRDVTIKYGNNGAVKSGWDGSFAIDSVGGEISLSKPGYMMRRMKYEELTDTIELLPTFNKLSEVVIWGKRQTASTHFSLKQITQTDVNMMNGGKAGIGFDFFGGISNILNHRKRKNSEAVKKILKNY